MTDEKFTNSVSKMYNDIFPDHEICYFHYSKDKSLIKKNYSTRQHEIVSNGSKDIKAIFRLIDLCRMYDYIVVHSFLFFSNIHILFLYFNKEILDKLIWIEFGADLYELEKPASKSIDKVIKYKLKYNVLSRIKNVVCIFPPDIKYYREKFPNSNAKVYYAPYTGAFTNNNDMYKYDLNYSMLKNAHKSGETIYIQIGHQANKQLNHLKVLDDLVKFKDNNIHLIIPLSYGDKSNAQAVEKKAVELFGNKVTILKDFISIEDYRNLMDKVSIAIFNTKRQIALGNINFLIKKNVKIYIPSDGVMFDFFKSYGACVEDYYALKSMSFEEFSKYNMPEIKITEYIELMSDYSQKIKCWSDIYLDLEERTLYGKK